MSRDSASDAEKKVRRGSDSSDMVVGVGASGTGYAEREQRIVDGKRSHGNQYDCIPPVASLDASSVWRRACLSLVGVQKRATSSPAGYFAPAYARNGSFGFHSIPPATTWLCLLHRSIDIQHTGTMARISFFPLLAALIAVVALFLAAPAQAAKGPVITNKVGSPLPVKVM